LVGFEEKMRNDIKREISGFRIQVFGSPGLQVQAAGGVMHGRRGEN
jgi:hypothetical protein